MAPFHLECIACHLVLHEDAYRMACPRCTRGCLEVVLDNARHERTIDHSKSSIFQFHRLMPFEVHSGSTVMEHFDPTPEFIDDELSDYAGVTIVVKDETVMPTGTWKDREGFLSIYRMVQNGIQDVVLFSSGNTGLSLARSASMFRGPRLHIVVPVASENRVRALLDKYDNGFVEIIVYDGSNDECIEEGKRLSVQKGYALEGGFFNYARREGLKLLGLEHIFCSGQDVAWYAQAVAGGIGLYAFDKAHRDCGLTSPQILGVQAAVCAPMVAAWRDGAAELRSKHIHKEIVPSDFVRVLRTRDPGHAYSVVKSVVDRCGGAFESVVDSEILAALRAFYRSNYFLGRYQDHGVLLGLEAATALAGVTKAVGRGIIDKSATVLLNVSGAAKAGDVKTEWIADLTR